jgi:hypothetical protein
MRVELALLLPTKFLMHLIADFYWHASVPCETKANTGELRAARTIRRL